MMSHCDPSPSLEKLWLGFCCQAPWRFCSILIPQIKQAGFPVVTRFFSQGITLASQTEAQLFVLQSFPVNVCKYLGHPITHLYSHPFCFCSAKRPAGMSSILSRIGGKKQKMSTLEKSKMDWDAFKSEEGITEELAIHNRGREG
ncbi:hypothetical protein ILYODFUR_032316 [Ilyodon furcidens]|uniref:Craniofacial development protein 1 n=1 Tax=Ilyodon furcidens TaxID=33524 RepID=A0ABV0TQF0_9TELE